MKKHLLLICLYILFITTASAQNEQEVYPIAFYNVENLFDTVDDPKTDDESFTPKGSLSWTEDKYEKKINNIAYVIDRLGKESSNRRATIIGIAEVENSNVLDDLLKTKILESANYKYIHYDSPDKRGIDVALIYNSSEFVVNSSKIFPYNMEEDPSFRTRDILLVSGKLRGEPLHVLVNHWPSRLGMMSSELREYAASICKRVCDSIYKSDSKAKIIIMGDMNDDPRDRSCRLVLDAKKHQSEVKQGGLFNTMWEMHEKGMGSLCYKGAWNLFDQIIISESLLNKKSSLRYWRSEIFNKDFLIQQEGQYKGYPLRTFSGKTFLNGYSDHFPTLIYLISKK